MVGVTKSLQFSFNANHLEIGINLPSSMNHLLDDYSVPFHPRMP